MRIGSQHPTKLVVPSYEYSEWRECHELNEVGGLQMLEWQDTVMVGWLGRNSFGRWSSPTCAGSLPRQNGKSLGLVESRSNYGMVVLAEQVLYTSHLQKTSTETFEDMASFFDSKKLRKYVKDIKTALGREQIILKNGGRIKFLARTRNGGRGQHGDLLIFDEALELDAESQASFLPAISASRNPQTIYVSTPPTPKSVGYVLRNIRSRALSGESDKTAWFEWSVDEIGDVTDRDRWYDTNPSLGILIQESTIDGEAEQMDHETFARERLGWWMPVTTDIVDHPVNRDDWDACATKNPPDTERPTYAVKMAHDGTHGVIAVCAIGDNDVPHVELACDQISLAGGVRRFREYILDVADFAESIVIDGRGIAQALIDQLVDADIDEDLLVLPSSNDMSTACATFVDAICARSLTHFDQAPLNDAVCGCGRRRIGTAGGFGFQSAEGADATIAEAAALAYWCATDTRRNPPTELRIG